MESTASATAKFAERAQPIGSNLIRCHPPFVDLVVSLGVAVLQNEAGGTL